VEKDAGKLRGRVGCALVVLVAIGAVVATGLWLGRKRDAERTPCERYMRTLLTAGDHCHSGVTRNAEHHLAICERSIEPTEACFDAIRAMTCPEINADPTGVSLPACQKRRPAPP
jgi:hypothetical protein